MGFASAASGGASCDLQDPMGFQRCLAAEVFHAVVGDDVEVADVATSDHGVEPLGITAEGLPVHAVDTPRDVVEAADVVCTLTPSRTPIVKGDWFRPGQHINAVGAPPRPDHREIDSDGMARATIVVDDYEISIQKSGDSVLALADGVIENADLRNELGQVITGTATGRTRPEQITLYNSVGVAIQDLAIARLLINRAREWVRGRDIS